MKYPTQPGTMKRLEDESLKAIDSIIENGRDHMVALLLESKRQLKSIISDQYRSHHRGGNWDIVSAKTNGSLTNMAQGIHSVMEVYRDESIRLMEFLSKKTYRQSALRQAWILDQITPASHPVKMPKTRMMMESVRSGTMADWKVRVEEWSGAYEDALYRNLRLNAISEGDIGDAVDEVDATKSGSPAMFIGDAMDRIFLTTMVFNSSQAALDVSAENGDLVMKEVWQTRYKLDVCEICQDNKGLTIEESDSDIPAHPNCRCYWRLVPETFADLLRSGDLEDQYLAKEMDSRNLVPGSLISRDEDGHIVGATVISFNKWLDSMPIAVMGGV